MKRNLKFTSIVMAALLATTPVVSLASNTANTVQAATSTTKDKATSHFLGGLSVYTNSTKISAATSINNVSLTNNVGTTIEAGDTVLNDGKYTLSAQITIAGVTPTSTDRSLTIVNSNGDIVGAASVAAHSAIAQGELNFSFTIKNGQMSNTSLGSIVKKARKTTKKKAKVTKRKHKKTTHKKSHKKVTKHSKKRR